MMKKVTYIQTSKKGNRYFKIGNKTYVIIDRPKDEIGSNNNYATEIVLEIKK